MVLVSISNFDTKMTPNFVDDTVYALCLIGIQFNIAHYGLKASIILQFFLNIAKF